MQQCNCNQKKKRRENFKNNCITRMTETHRAHSNIFQQEKGTLNKNSYMLCLVYASHIGSSGEHVQARNIFKACNVSINNTKSSGELGSGEIIFLKAKPNIITLSSICNESYFITIFQPQWHETVFNVYNCVIPHCILTNDRLFTLWITNQDPPGCYHLC